MDMTRRVKEAEFVLVKSLMIIWEVRLRIDLKL